MSDVRILSEEMTLMPDPSMTTLIDFLKADNDRLRRELAEARDEARRLWAAAGHLRMGYGVYLGADYQAQGENPIPSDVTDRAAEPLGEANRLLGGLVPLTPAK